jgi:hypothetical protein
LEWSDRFDEALTCASEMLKDPTLSLSAEERLRLRERVAYNLWKLKKIDEAAAVYDDLIVQASGNDRMVWSFLRDKAEMLTYANRLRESLETWTLARKCVHKGSDEWLTTEIVGITWNLIKLERFAEAEAVHEEVAKSGTKTPLEIAGILVGEAFQYKKVGGRPEALAKVREAENLLADIKPSRYDQAELDQIRSGIKTIIDEANAAEPQGQKGIE